jgi:hypothetical protein
MGKTWGKRQKMTSPGFEPPRSGPFFNALPFSLSPLTQAEWQIPIYSTFICFLFWDLVLILRTVKGRSSWVLYRVPNSDKQGDM